MRRKRTIRINIFFIVVLIMSASLLGGCEQESNLIEHVESTVQQKEEKDVEEIEQAEALTEENQDSAIVQEYGEMTGDFYFVIEDVFTLIEQNAVVVVGINQNAPMYTGTKVEVLSLNGRLQTSIGGIEVYDKGLVDGVPTGSNVGVLLDGLTADDIQPGDVILMSGEGNVSNRAYVLGVVMENVSPEQIAKLSPGETVQIYHGLVEPLNVVVEAVVVEDGENPDVPQPGDIISLIVTLEKETVFATQHSMAIYVGEELLASGYICAE